MKRLRKSAMTLGIVTFMTSSTGLTVDYLEKSDPAPFDSIIMTEPEFRKMSEELFTCDLIKQEMKKDLNCEDAKIIVNKDIKWWFLVSGLFIGYIARGN